MLERLVDDLLAELEKDPNYNKKEDEDLVQSCANRAMMKFRAFRQYPSSYSESDIQKDMDNYYACILDLAFYCFDKQGIQFETTHTENTTQRTFISETTIFKEYGVCKFVQLFY